MSRLERFSSARGRPGPVLPIGVIWSRDLSRIGRNPACNAVISGQFAALVLAEHHPNNAMEPRRRAFSAACMVTPALTAFLPMAPRPLRIERLLSWLSDEDEQISALLEHLSGTLSLTLSCHGPVAAAPSATTGLAGRLYLRQRAQEETSAAEMHEKCTLCLDKMIAPFRVMISSVRKRSFGPQPIGKGANGAVERIAGADLSLLVIAERAQLLRERLENVSESMVAADGLRVRIGGPWPAYGFCDLPALEAT